LAALPDEEQRACLLADLNALPDDACSDHQISALLVLLSQAYVALGHVFRLGFLKGSDDPCPDTGLELASLAWERCRDAAVLDCMLQYSAQLGIEGELLPHLRYAIEKGLADDRQILRAAELAEGYYDKELAQTILLALSKVRKFV